METQTEDALILAPLPSPLFFFCITQHDRNQPDFDDVLIVLEAQTGVNSYHPDPFPPETYPSTKTLHSATFLRPTQPHLLRARSGHDAPDGAVEALP